MRKKTFAKIIIPVVAVVGLVMFINPEIFTPITSMLGYTAGFGNQIVWLFIILGLLGAVLIVFLPIINNKYELGILKASFGAQSDKTYSVKENVEAVMDFMDPFGIDSYSQSNGGSKLHVVGTVVDSHTSDTPFSIIAVSTAPTRMNYKTMFHETGEHGIHFLFVDRKSNEVSYDPDIENIKDAVIFKDKLRADALPLEKKKTMMDKATEAMMGGFLDKKGRDAANGAETESKGEVKE